MQYPGRVRGLPQVEAGHVIDYFAAVWKCSLQATVLILLKSSRVPGFLAFGDLAHRWPFHYLG